MTTTETPEQQVGPNWVALADRDNPWNIIGASQGLLYHHNESTHAPGYTFTAEEALTECGLNFEVKKYPVWIDMSRDHSGNKQVRRDDLFVTGYEEKTTGDIRSFGVVSDKYEVVQPVEALSMFDEIVSKVDGAHYSAAWNMPEKARMGITIELPDALVVDPQGANDRITEHLLGVNSFDGSTALLGLPIGTRFFCTNQVPMLIRGAKAKGFSFRHTKTVKARAGEAQRLLAATMDYFKGWEKIANKLHAQKMSDRQFEKFLTDIDPFKLDDTAGDLTKERIRERRADAVLAWKAPHNENICGTAWGALNVVTEFAQWGRTVQGSARTGTDARRQRAIGTMVHPDIEKWGRQALEAVGVPA